MNDNIKLEVAIEIMASKIASMTQKGYTIEDNELKHLLVEKEQMYIGNEGIINKIIEQYGKELREAK